LKGSAVNVSDACGCSQDMAKLLGYSNYAEMSLSSKMAGSVENVFSMINRWHLFICMLRIYNIAQQIMFSVLYLWHLLSIAIC